MMPSSPWCNLPTLVFVNSMWVCLHFAAQKCRVRNGLALSFGFSRPLRGQKFCASAQHSKQLGPFLQRKDRSTYPQIGHPRLPTSKQERTFLKSNSAALPHSAELLHSHGSWRRASTSTSPPWSTCALEGPHWTLWLSVDAFTFWTL